MEKIKKVNGMQTVGKPWRLYIAFSLVGLIFALLMLFGSYNAVHLIKEHSTAFDALGNIDTEINNAHIWYNAVFSDKENNQIEQAEHKIDNAHRYVSSLTKQDTINGIIYYAFDEPKLIKNINSISTELKNIKVIGEKHFAEKTKTGKAEGMPAELTALINKVSKSVNNVTSLVRTTTTDELHKFEIIRIVIILLFIVFQILLLLAIYIYNKHRKQDFSSIKDNYEKLQEAYVNLEIAEGQIKENEKQYRTLVGKAPVGIHELDRKGDFISINQADIKLRNYSKTDEIIGSSYFDFISEPDRDRIKKLFSEALRGKASEFEYIAKKKDNSQQIISADFIPLLEENGTVNMVMGISQDITDVITYGKKLEKANRLYAILSEINQTIVRIDNTQELYDKVCEIFVEFGKFKLAWIGIVDFSDKSFKPVASYGSSNGYFKNLEFSLDNEKYNNLTVIKKLLDNEIVIFNNIKEDVDYPFWREDVLKAGFVSGAAVPITMKNKVIGIISIGSAHVNYFGEQEHNLLTEIGLDISFAVEKIDSEKKRRHAEKEQQQSEIRYRNLYQQSNDAIYLLYNNKFEIVNKKFTQLFGYTLEEVNSKDFDFIKLVSPKSLPIIEERIKRSINGEKVSPIYEFTAIAKDRKEIECETSVTYLDYKGGRATQGIIRDITARKQAIKEVENSEKSYRELFDNNEDGIYLQDRQGKFLLVNQGAVKMYGYQREFFIGKTPEVLAAPGKNDLQAVQKMISKAWEGEPQNFEFWGKRKNGEIFPKEVRLKKSSYFGQEVVIAFGRDITEKKRKEEIIRTSEQRYRTLFDASSDSIMLIRDKKFVDCNPKTLKMFKCSRDQIIGKTPGQFSPTYQPNGKASIDLADEIIERCKTDEYSGFEWELTKYDGENFSAEIGLSRIELSGETFTLAIIRDISERKKAEKELVQARKNAEKSDRLKSEFLAQMSHEIRTPINTILSFSSLVKYELEDKVSSDLKESFVGIESAGRRIIRTIDLILNMSELQANSYDYRPRIINLHKEIFKKLELEYHSIVNGKGISLIFDHLVKEPVIFADEYTVMQIFSNLVDNAVKYTMKGEVRLSCEKKDLRLSVSVKDTGIGISEEYLPKLFDAFSQEEQGYTRSFEGNGLGMAIVKKYCEMNNAEIQVKSQKGKGTTFTITFELAK